METYNIELSNAELDSLLMICCGYSVDRNRFIDLLIPSIDDRRIAIEKTMKQKADDLWVKLCRIQEGK